MRKEIIILLVLFGVFLAIGCTGNKGSSPNNTVTPVGYQSGHMGPGMMGNQGQMGPGMMNNQGYNYSYGPGMMGNMMMGNMMAIYYPESKPIAQEEALRNMQSFATQYGSNLTVEDFMAFSSNYYAVMKDTGSNQDIAEVIVDRYSGSTYPEPGPNMMWNTRFGAGRTQGGGNSYDLAGAQKLAEDFLTGYLPGAQIQESHAMPGYYTFDFGRNDTESMLSVNAFSGQIWVHTWHGPYLGGMNVTS